MRRATIALLALALIGLTVAPIAGALTLRFPTTVTIKLNHGKGGKNSTAPDSFQGNVNSPKPKCTRNRTVIVSRDGAFVGQTTSSSTGSWTLGLPGQAAAGHYTATVPRKVYHRRHRPRRRIVCKQGVSKALNVKAGAVYTQ